MLEPLTLRDKKLFDRYARKSFWKLSTYAFAPIYVWRELFQFYWTIIDDQLCVFACQNGDYFMPIMPLGRSPSREAIRKSYLFMLETNRAKPIARIENIPETSVAFFQDLGFQVFGKETEYLYSTDSLIQLSGTRYKSKRGAYNTFMRNQSEMTLAPYQPEDYSDCMELFNLWRRERRKTSSDPLYLGMLEDSEHAHRAGLLNAAELGLEGIVVRTKGELRAYSFGYSLNHEVYCIVFEITDPRLKGIAQFLFREFCRRKAIFPIINAMDDSGLDNLKRVKLSYLPSKQIRSYNVVFPTDDVSKLTL
ncbi:MAG: phosphatidylglycerol lysyltransferase domain-containing protein [Candidatus Poribacteria bacterium]|nr:phosphatidylglycerol lysyltransferase domain-containing protein [Candidatus Poribacteria bacterium]MDE0503288.1 phosphatidylglycerol lysyltransferase domain-containing protein [Candidatus Poribacteria bacterium]